MGTSPARTMIRLLLMCAGLLLLLSRSDRAVHALPPGELTHCRTAAFSTEEDFMMRGREPADGNPYVSDGDLLSPDGFICARNADLTRVFSPTGAPIQDLGLDAVDVLDADQYIVAFSTELDAPNGAFTSGDLLITFGGAGAVIPNLALVAAFGVKYDIGLDEVKFVGVQDKIMSFLDFARGKSRGFWLEQPALLQQELKRYQIDI